MDKTALLESVEMASQRVLPKTMEIQEQRGLRARTVAEASDGYPKHKSQTN
jgi:hypothetical protein